MSALSEKQIKDYNKALSLFQSGQFRDAEGVLKRLYKAAPEHTEINALLADCRFMTGKYDVALRDYARALRLDPNLAGAWKRIGHIEFAIKNNLAVAIEMLSKALALNPTDAETYYLLGTISQQMVQHADSAQMFQIGLQLAPKHAEMRAALALSQLDLRDFDAVKSNILQALKDAPQSDMVIVTALKISEVLPFSDDEETMIRKIAKENAGRGDLLSYVATYEAQRAMAEKDYDAALKILQDVDDKHLSIAPTKYFYLGKIYLSRKQYDQSFAAYER
ncbi:MAG: tetratricopeptide repeat protein, partial [Bdellovibrionales bacterium]